MCMLQAGPCATASLLEWGASSNHAVRMCTVRFAAPSPDQPIIPPLIGLCGCLWAAGADAIVWAREYSMREHSKCDCDTLQQVLGEMPGAQRMVVSVWIGAPGLCWAPTGLSAAEVW